MVTLFDLGAEFWRNYFGSRSGVDAYSLTLDRIMAYAEEGRLVVCADSPRSARKEMHAVYKSNRSEKPQDALESLRGVQERLVALGIPLALVDGWEADDVICTLTAKSWPEDVRIVGSEKDFFCLIDDDRVRLYGKNGVIESAACMDKFGCAPSQMTDWLTIVGDAADCIPGCPGCGPAKASALLERFGTLDAAKAATDDELRALKGFGPKVLENFRNWDPTMARSLVLMKDDLPISLEDLLGG